MPPGRRLTLAPSTLLARKHKATMRSPTSARGSRFWPLCDSEEMAASAQSDAESSESAVLRREVLLAAGYTEAEVKAIPMDHVLSGGAVGKDSAGGTKKSAWKGPLPPPRVSPPVTLAHLLAKATPARNCRRPSRPGGHVSSTMPSARAILKTALSADAAPFVPAASRPTPSAFRPSDRAARGRKYSNSNSNSVSGVAAVTAPSPAHHSVALSAPLSQAPTTRPDGKCFDLVNSSLRSTPVLQGGPSRTGVRTIELSSRSLHARSCTSASCAAAVASSTSRAPAPSASAAAPTYAAIVMSGQGNP